LSYRLKKVAINCVALLLLASVAVANERPNVLVVMVDDLGFSDLGCYGGEIETPNLDRLAADGLRFAEFYNTAKCHSSRVSLLTGCYALQAGDVKLDHAVTSAEMLSQAGYFTAMTGKWHLSKEPTDFGFDRYFGHLSGACNYFKGDKTFRLNGQPWEVPSEGFYTTIAKVDYAIDFLAEARASSKPWYLYVAFNAPHAPLQALEEDYRKYAGRYDIGWDRIRDARFAKQKKLGLFDASTKISPRPDHVPAWDTLSESRRAWESRRMTALAGMIDRVDRELGRLIDDLRVAGELENTMILFVSDNGACPYDRRSVDIEAEPTNGSVSWSDSTGWAWARNAPFRYYKQNQYEGGISTPAIVHWPQGLKTQPGAIVAQPAHLVDVLPTLGEVCDAAVPTSWPGRDLRPISGVSLAKLFAGQPLGPRPPIHLLFASDRGLRDGDWKVVSYRSQPWELYNLVQDRTELNDLAAQEPQRLKAMVATWTEMTRDILQAPANSYAPVAAEATGHHHPEWTDFSAEPREGYGKATPDGNKAGKGKRAERTSGIRARKNTKMTVKRQELHLVCTGDDPGLAIDQIKRPIAAGPYTLSFRLRSTADRQGEIFFTTDPQTSLPRGQRVEFQPINDGQWHSVSIPLATKKTIVALRIDVCGGPGEATLSDLELQDHHGNVLRSWP